MRFAFFPTKTEKHGGQIHGADVLVEHGRFKVIFPRSSDIAFAVKYIPVVQDLDQFGFTRPRHEVMRQGDDAFFGRDIAERSALAFGDPGTKCDGIGQCGRE